MITLAIDTSHAVGSVALARDGALLSSEQFRAPASHLVALGRTVESALARAGLGPSSIERLAVVTGPGSFTGLRIGLSFAKGLHAATGVPLVTIDALRLLALPWLSKGRVCAMIDARRGETYAALYEFSTSPQDAGAAKEMMAPRVVAPQTWLSTLDATPDVFVGTGAAAHTGLIRASFSSAEIPADDAPYPSTAHLATIAHRMTPLDENAVRTLEPLYVRPSGAETMRLRSHAAERNDG
jgi:tRNA threonylcarbamoyladenosine biosynthesis protein TsaB